MTPDSLSVSPPPFPGGNDLRAVKASVRAANTSFHYAMYLLPKRRRYAIWAVYAFCRVVDDIADDHSLACRRRLEKLGRWRNEIARVYEGAPSCAISRVLAWAVGEFALAREDLLAVIDGMEMDVNGPVIAPGEDQLDLYCDRVACAVGRLCVVLFGIAGPEGKALAAELGRALQLTNILRDVGEDLGLGRLYLPRERLRAHGVDWSHLPDVVSQPGFVPLWRGMAAQARDHFTHARRILRRCDRKAARPARIMLEIYQTNLERMCALDDAAISDSGVSKRLVTRLEKLGMALRYGGF